ncbi:hypothetical protein [Paenibacillus ehimensis]|uniref:hypothetical protein n=1 Tax=Paenibacillus ehimensis TaxID=79264 RepID=UPI00046E766A|nr:hypothetical protein [Paenibacillus ehimensis]
MKKKIASVILSAALVCSYSSSVFASSPIHETLNKKNDHILTVKAQNVLKNVDLSSANLLDSYMTVDAKGLLHLDDAGKKVVSTELFNHVARGVESINVAVQVGTVVLDAKNQRVVPTASTSVGTQSIVSPDAFSNTYWWGVAMTMNEDETKSLAYSLQQVKEGFTAVAVVAAAIGGIMGLNPAPWAAAAAAAIVACGAAWVSNGLTFHNNSKGVTLNIHWLPGPYYEITKNS